MHQTALLVEGDQYARVPFGTSVPQIRQSLPYLSEMRIRSSGSSGCRGRPGARLGRGAAVGGRPSSAFSLLMPLERAFSQSAAGASVARRLVNVAEGFKSSWCDSIFDREGMATIRDCMTVTCGAGRNTNLRCLRCNETLRSVGSKMMPPIGRVVVPCDGGSHSPRSARVGSGGVSCTISEQNVGLRTELVQVVARFLPWGRRGCRRRCIETAPGGGRREDGGRRRAATCSGRGLGTVPAACRVNPCA